MTTLNFHLARMFLMGKIAKPPIYTTSPKCPENATWKFPLITPYRRATSKERYYYEWHSICVFGESDNQLLHQILCKGSWLYIEGHLSRRTTLNWRHQPQFWYEVVVPWNGKGVVLPIGGARRRSIEVDGATPPQTTTEWMSPNRIRKYEL
ncbi:hypothetical protein GAYE_SCF46G5803 [Galdieria yellowstonensis]|uniref:Uncharacterized protein n=1 Tax=Galdieria yellowstonensis TaxID=3028027 RepID=A0AAV9IKF6_9RHOD|nr:hypothetical protein GAYE_SCF46G5803 [Galdieria yellowstonensis]